MDKTEDTILTIGDITLMIEGDTLMMEGITSIMERITLMIEGITSMTEQLGDKCTMKVLIEEGFLRTLDQNPHFWTILKPHLPTVGDHRTLHQVHALGGRCRLGDPSTLLPPDILWSLRFPMKEVGGGTEDIIMIDIIDDWSFVSHLLITMLSLVHDWQYMVTGDWDNF